MTTATKLGVTTTVEALTRHWGSGPEEWGLPADTAPEATVRAEYRPDERGWRLEMEHPDQEDLPAGDRRTRPIHGPGPHGTFGLEDLPPETRPVTGGLREALEEAGREIMRGRHEEAGVPADALEITFQAQGDAEYLDEVAREHGLDDGMPSGYSSPPEPEWRAVFAGAETYIEEVSGSPEQVQRCVMMDDLRWGTVKRVAERRDDVTSASHLLRELVDKHLG